MAVKYDLMVASGTYQADGITKTRWNKVGVVMEKRDGNGLVMKLESIPTATIDRDGNPVAWDGWVQMFEPRPRDITPTAKQHDQEKSNGYQPQGKPDFDDDMPF